VYAGAENMNNILSIRDDLQIIGPLKTSGEGSVYKARRTDRLVSAVKVLPQPLSWEKLGDASLNNTRHELSKLKRLGEYPHNNLVKILNAGVSKAGDSFYIEMDFIEGPDLEHLLQIPDHTILTITETLNLAEQLCNALEHCHKMDVVHGEVKLGNIKWNRNTGNYLLVDMGLSVMQELQRRARILTAENKELAAPEEEDGKMTFQTDIFRFGLILFRLLAGTYPRLKKNDLPAKNGQVKRADPLADMVSLRQQNIPASWAYEKEDREKVIPGWLVTLVYKCLETNPEKRFANGMELRDFFSSQTAPGTLSLNDVAEAGKLRAENEKLARENRELQAALQRQEFNEKIVHRQWKEINDLVSLKEKELEELKQRVSRPVLSGRVISGLIIVAMLAGAFTSYLFLPARTEPNDADDAMAASVITDTIATQKNKQSQTRPAPAQPTVKQNRQKNNAKLVSQEVPQAREKPTGTPEPGNELSTSTSAGNAENNTPLQPDADLGEYKVKSKAYFHDEPDESSRRKAFIVHWNNAVLKPIVEQDSFIFVVFTNHLGQTSKGWLNKNDLTRID
jgi:serine/threonine-protein kinase